MLRTRDNDVHRCNRIIKTHQVFPGVCAHIPRKPQLASVKMERAEQWRCRGRLACDNSRAQPIASNHPSWLVRLCRLCLSRLSRLGVAQPMLGLAQVLGKVFGKSVCVARCVVY